MMQFFTLYSSKIEDFGTHFFDIVAAHNDHPSYVKHVLAALMCFSRRGGWGPILNPPPPLPMVFTKMFLSEYWS